MRGGGRGTCAGGKIERFTCTDSIIKISRYPLVIVRTARTFTPTRASFLMLSLLHLSLIPLSRPALPCCPRSASRAFLRNLTRKLFKSHSPLTLATDRRASSNFPPPPSPGGPPSTPRREDWPEASAEPARSHVNVEKKGRQREKEGGREGGKEGRRNREKER